MMNSMPETSWQRLYRLAEKRRERRGMSRADLTSQGGPSSETMRGLQLRVGAPTSRQREALDSLDIALGWEIGTSWELAQPAREAMTEDFLADEEERLIEAKPVRSVDAHEQAIRDMASNVEGALRKQSREDALRMMIELQRILNGWA